MSAAVTWGFRVAISGWGAYKLKRVADDPWRLEAPLDFLEGYAFFVAPWATLRNPSIKAGTKLGGLGLRLVRGGWGLTNFIRFGTGTVSIGAGQLAASVLAGYLLGASVGTGIAYVGWGKKGATEAFELYTGQVSPSQYIEAVAIDPFWYKFDIALPIAEAWRGYIE